MSPIRFEIAGRPDRTPRSRVASPPNVGWTEYPICRRPGEFLRSFLSGQSRFQSRGLLRNETADDPIIRFFPPFFHCIVYTILNVGVWRQSGLLYCGVCQRRSEPPRRGRQLWLARHFPKLDGAMDIRHTASSMVNNAVPVPGLPQDEAVAEASPYCAAILRVSPLILWSPRKSRYHRILGGVRECETTFRSPTPLGHGLPPRCECAGQPLMRP